MISANELFVKGDKFHCRVCGTELIFIDVDNKPVTLLDGAKDNYSNKVTNDNANIFFLSYTSLNAVYARHAENVETYSG